MEVKFEKGSEKWQLFVDYYKFIQDYGAPEDSDEWWQELFTASTQLCNKFRSGEYIRDLVMAHVNELERKAKEIKK
jgi:predicted  nucleic acid-binding Zn ribbon protein